MSLRSGTIRMSISTSKRFLNDRVKLATALLDDDLPVNSSDCQETIDKLTEISELIQTSIINLEKKDSEWQNLIQESDDDAAVNAEQNLYESAATIEPQGYLIAINEAQSIVGRISTRLRQIKRVLGGFSGDPSQTFSGGGLGSGDGSQIPHIFSNTLASRVKAPKIMLPTFEGDILKWKEFWSIFSSTIHNRSDLSDVEKFSYILPQIKGRARQSIEGLLITDENYEVAVEILKQRFDRSDDRLVSMLYGELKQLPRCGMRRDDKRRTFDTCERIFRQLQLAGEDVDSNRALTIDLLSKFPSGMVRDLQRHFSVGVHSRLSDVRIGIEKSISELETTSGILDDLDAISGPSAKQKSINTTGKNRNGQPYDASPNASSSSNVVRENSAFYTVTNAPDSVTGERTRSRDTAPTTPSSNCYFCDGKHFNGDCTKYATAKSREQRLYDLKRCIKCGRNHNPGGKRNQCNNAQVKCVHCRTNDHYSALCRVRYPSNTDNRQKNTKHKPNKSPGDSSVQTSDEPHGHQACVAVDQAADITILNNTNARNALFQTAKVKIANPDTKKSISMRICLDSLSNRSYITEKAADMLNLASRQYDKLMVSVFGSQKCVEVPTRLVKFGVLQADGSTRIIEANTTKIISNSGVLPRNWPDKEMELLQSMKRSHTLADDPFDVDKSVDVLIGADYVWEFITGGKISSSMGIYFIPSTVGLMLAGQLRYADDSFDTDRSSAMLCIIETPRKFSHELNLLTEASYTKLEPNYPDIDEYWKLETIGISDCPVENDDDKALENFHKTIRYENG